MASYIVINDIEVEPEAPIISSLGFRWRDNAIAIAEGATGAPRVVYGALNLSRDIRAEDIGVGEITLTELSDGTAGLIPLQQITASDTQPVFTTGLTSYDVIQVEFSTLMPSSDGGDIQIEFSDDNGSTYSAPVELLGNVGSPVNLTEGMDGRITIYNDSSDKPITYRIETMGRNSSGTFTSNSASGEVVLATLGSPQQANRLRISSSSGANNIRVGTARSYGIKHS